MRQAVILAGGRGTRLGAILGGKPKALADVGGTPLLGHQLNLLAAHHFDEAVLLVNHGAAHIEGWLAANRSPLPVRVIHDGIARGTAGAVLSAIYDLTSEFLVLYSDTMLNVDLSRFLNWHQSDRTAAASLFLHPNDHPFDSDIVEVDQRDRVLRFHPYPHSHDACLPNLVNAALYVIRRDSLWLWRDSQPPLDFAKHLFPQMLAAGHTLRGYRSPEYIKDAGTIERLERVRKAWIEGDVQRSSIEYKRRAVLIDRDGTLTHDFGHITRAENLQIYDFAGPAMRRLHDAGWLTVLVSNQPVLARGETSDAEMRRIHARLDSQLAHCGAYLDGIYICPHHPEGGFSGEVAALKMICSCRKPAPGLITRASNDLNLDLIKSWFVGDSTADLGAAENAGLTSILVETGNGGLDGKYPYEAGITVRDFSAAVDFILDVFPCLASQAKPIVAKIKAGQDWFVGGLSRSGKSTFAATLARELCRHGQAVRIVHLDRWIVSKADRQPGVFGRFDMAAIEGTIERARTRRRRAVEINLPTYNRSSQRREEQILRITLHPSEVVIWEGVVAIELARRMGVCTQSVYLETDEIARRARFDRFQGRRGHGPPASAALFATRERDEHEPIRALGARAAFRISLDEAFIPTLGTNGCEARA